MCLINTEHGIRGLTGWLLYLLVKGSPRFVELHLQHHVSLNGVAQLALEHLIKQLTEQNFIICLRTRNEITHKWF